MACLPYSSTQRDELWIVRAAPRLGNVFLAEASLRYFADEFGLFDPGGLLSAFSKGYGRSTTGRPDIDRGSSMSERPPVYCNDTERALAA